MVKVSRQGAIMKRSIIILLLLFFISTLFSIQNWDKLKLKGKVKQFEEINFNNDKMISKKIYNFNKIGFLIKVEYYSDDSLFLSTVYKYDDKNINTGYIDYDEEGKILRTHLCEYKNDRLIQIKILDSNEQLNYTGKYEYDIKGNLVRMEEWNKNNEIETYHLSKYDEKNNLIELSHHFPAGRSQKFQYFYNDKNELIKEETFYNDIKEFVTLFSYEYNETGNIIKTKKINIKDGAEIGKEEVLYKYFYYN